MYFFFWVHTNNAYNSTELPPQQATPFLDTKYPICVLKKKAVDCRTDTWQMHAISIFYFLKQTLITLVSRIYVEY